MCETVAPLDPSPSSSPADRGSDGAIGVCPAGERAPAAAALATAVSGRAGAGAPSRGRFGALARRSLASVPVMVVVASCLVTSTPDLTPAPQQPPYLLVGGASPDPRTPVVIASDQKSQTFSASVVVNDTSAVVLKELLIDYGAHQDSGFKALAEMAPVAIAPTGSAVRPVSFKWFPGGGKGQILFGCHTVTMIVSHGFDNSIGCPWRLCDSSQLTWLVNYGLGPSDGCKPSDYPTPTDTCPLDDLPPEATAADHAALHQQYPCPGDDADAGAP